MDFEVFNKTDIEQMYRDMLKNMTDEQKDIFIKEYGEAWKRLNSIFSWQCCQPAGPEEL